jgi:hypothetical protein
MTGDHYDCRPSTTGDNLGLQTIYDWRPSTTGDNLGLETIYDWRQPRTGDHLRLETIYDWRQPRTADHLRLETIYDWRQPRTADHLRLETIYDWRQPRTGDHLRLETRTKLLSTSLRNCLGLQRPYSVVRLHGCGPSGLPTTPMLLSLPLRVRSTSLCLRLSQALPRNS